MTNSNTVQQARDALAKWRKNPESRSAWERFDAAGLGEDIASGDRGYLGSFDDPTDVSLIVGTAGNPELLDAIDGLLADAQEHLADLEATGSGALASLMNITGGGRHHYALRIAAEIIAADERMNA